MKPEMAAPLLASLALVAIGFMFALLLCARRIHANRMEREDLAARREAEPVLHALLDGDEVDRSTSADDAALATLLAEISPSLAGDTRNAIADHFESSGAIGRASRGLGHPLAHRRAESAALLGDMCSDQAEPVLLLALNDRDPDVRLAATRSLGRLRSRSAVIPILHSLACRHVPRAVAANAVLTIGAAALPGIRTLISTEHPATRAAAVELLGRLGNPRDGESLRDRLADRAPLVRERACEALAHLGADDVDQALEDLLADDVRNVRAAAAAALATVGGPHNAARLLEIVHDDCAEVAEVAAATLASIAPSLVARMGTHEDAHPRLRHAASMLQAGLV
jgi:HEAT repeat protein